MKGKQGFQRGDLNPSRSKSIWNKGRKMTDEEKKAQSERIKRAYAVGKVMGFKKDHPSYSEVGRFVKNQNPWNKGKSAIWVKGEKHHLWKGGISSNEEKLRKSIEYRLWREAVFNRDNFTCTICGERGGELNADHIKPFSQYPELRLSLDNGRTLCVSCHRKTDTWGARCRKR